MKSCRDSLQKNILNLLSRGYFKSLKMFLSYTEEASARLSWVNTFLYINWDHPVWDRSVNVNAIDFDSWVLKFYRYAGNQPPGLK